MSSTRQGVKTGWNVSRRLQIHASTSDVQSGLPKLEVAGSKPVRRSVALLLDTVSDQHVERVEFRLSAAAEPEHDTGILGRLRLRVTQASPDRVGACAEPYSSHRP
jgi:hypothetical protein